MLLRLDKSYDLCSVFLYAILNIRPWSSMSRRSIPVALSADSHYCALILDNSCAYEQEPVTVRWSVRS